ncbi:sensor histidine kinase [Hymenobacter sp. H14-R3]|uniref:sensor histidine kinase n=1 Tax=Hymenobacter sp. H14-R3 TaxID=3046308 RepID=UPI0024BADC0A|nr:sensor histidine kinase [Hymenobacter sp. H14-R3]MDJ0365804.1 sensor histidine kinase [Hymenobacter sp. H14-R3]
MDSPFAAQRPSRSDLVFVAAYWLVVAPILLVQYRAENHASAWQVLPEVAGTVVLDTATVALLLGGLLPLLLGRRRGLGLALLPVFVGLSGAAYFYLYDYLIGKPHAISAGRILFAAVQHAQSYGLLAVLLTGKRYFEAQNRVLLLQKAQTESELRALKAQLDPHFLFNNLHVLHMLIGQDAAVAGHYLGCFANLYRYLLRHRDADFVTLAEELQFLDDYVYLLRHRFGAAYAFETTLAPGLDPARLHTVPGTLQILIENALKHNSGDDDDPLAISLFVSPQSLRVRNPQRPKHTRPEPGGTGLRNLQERYRLLAGQPVQIDNSAASFAVTVPLLHQVPGQ